MASLSGFSFQSRIIAVRRIVRHIHYTVLVRTARSPTCARHYGWMPVAATDTKTAPATTTTAFSDCDQPVPRCPSPPLACRLLERGAKHLRKEAPPERLFQ